MRLCSIFRCNQVHEILNSLRCFFISRGQMKQAFAAPDTDNPYPSGVSPVHDAEWWVDEFAQKGLIEFGDHPAHVWMVSQYLNTLKHLSHKPRPNIGHTLTRVPRPHLFEIMECGFREADCHSGHSGVISGQAAHGL